MASNGVLPIILSRLAKRAEMGDSIVGDEMDIGRSKTRKLRQFESAPRALTTPRASSQPFVTRSAARARRVEPAFILRPRTPACRVRRRAGETGRCRN